MTHPQYVTLLALWEEPDEPRTLGELCRRLHLDTGTLTPLLKRLETAGDLTRRRDPADERHVLVELTRHGLDLRQRVASVPASLAGCVGLDAAAATRSAPTWRPWPTRSTRPPPPGDPSGTRPTETTD